MYWTRYRLFALVPSHKKNCFSEMKGVGGLAKVSSEKLTDLFQNLPNILNNLNIRFQIKWYDSFVSQLPSLSWDSLILRGPRMSWSYPRRGGGSLLSPSNPPWSLGSLQSRLGCDPGDGQKMILRDGKIINRVKWIAILLVTWLSRQNKINTI